MKPLQVTSVRYFETRRGLGYECKTNVRGISIWNDGDGGHTYVDGNEYTKNYFIVLDYSAKYSEKQLEELIDKHENICRD
jgi:hypothetical protein